MYYNNNKNNIIITKCIQLGVKSLYVLIVIDKLNISEYNGIRSRNHIGNYTYKARSIIVTE